MKAEAAKARSEPYFWTKDDVAAIMQCSISTAYKMMNKWNKELSARGYETMKGRVPRRYAMDRLGLEARAI